MHGVLFLCLSLVAATSAYLRVPKDYHLEVGIPTATRIKEAEDKFLSSQNDGAQRIVGGNVAAANAHPYLAGLLITFFNNPGTSACGSSLISSNRLVTAAHCWDTGSLFVRQFVVVLGSQLLFSGGTRIATNNVVVHPQWNRSFLQNDIAIIYLPSNVRFSESIQPIALPENDLYDTFQGFSATAAGYGKTSDWQSGISVNSMVNEVNVVVIGNSQCQRSYGSSYVRPNVLCTDGIGGVGICGGDSGGPLVLRNRYGQQILVGISSFAASNACERGHPSGFVRVTSHYNFITQHL
ncbi:chymotrypsin serine protease precursor [Danaus plexippus plexippus]|uniref:Chymotrypsin serine protease n=1 Tax=Danaus plexippus plexippus TaxID=278856 RepID=A0A212F096_DANPL|nr:chymotrypsin BI-like [Danaus plexippus plexippus]OWR47160.1 chymotrypsin serine protease precursor [Danaus plexippus plexippus]